MTIAIELVTFPANEAFINDPQTLLQPVIDFVVARDGCLGFYWGFTEEDKTIVYAAIVWETLEHHLALNNDKENHPKLVAVLTKCVAAFPEIIHVHVKQVENIASTLGAPVTSYTHALGLKPENTAEDLLGGLGTLTKTEAPKGGRGGCASNVLEKPEFMLIYGWDSSEDYRKAVETDESFKGILSKFGEKVTEVKRTHVKFNVAKPYQG